MQIEFGLIQATSDLELTPLKRDWLDSLTSPQDGMWESFRARSVHWVISDADKVIGYACVDDTRQLLQFYISPEYLPQGEKIFEKFILEQNITTGMVGTNNPIYLSLALHFVKTLEVNTYLFRKRKEVNIEEKEGMLRASQRQDLERIADFCHNTLGASKAWLRGYLGELIEKGEVFALEKGGDIIGTCEVRKSATAPAFADIGMMVAPDYRRKGYGTYLLNKAKEIALEWGKTPICSCEKDNPGSYKSICNCGFVSMHQLLSVNF